ncbi:glucosamine-6-phosphate deaminase [Frigidibacter sp. ROC022]|uniref:glucosamine-6-phosphate deaminase n=1 Tax=Frigidibacter sp. ROC022 TaxID=2971796 RepID=UPI00215A89F9|nr:glucosamine-6-phosphate deaminase [Frigidibacter sp. ROC022]MCR8724570.1 glucosamine-6-phosphate deaminase [Frigidibacter sp. ROC022]
MSETLAPRVRHLTAEQLAVEIHPDRSGMARAAAAKAAGAIRDILARQGSARLSFAAAASQAEMLEALRAESGIDWSRVTAFHIDDYLDLPADAPQRFANWLDRNLFGKLPFGAVHRMPVDLGPERACAEYQALLTEAPIDLGLLGIGVNGHIAFNDPPVADFEDVPWVKVVELDDICRQQQVDDGAFDSFDQVPRRAVTLTVPALMAARQIVCTVPGRAKAAAVKRLLSGPVGSDCPATILRRHPNATLYLDAEAADA